MSEPRNPYRKGHYWYRAPVEAWDEGFAAALEAMTSEAALAEAKWWQGKDAVEAAVEAVRISYQNDTERAKEAGDE